MSEEPKIIKIGNFPHYRRLPYPATNKKIEKNLYPRDEAFKERVKLRMKTFKEKTNPRLDNLILSGTYQEAGGFDVENNLFYNFDNSECFIELAKKGIRFEKQPLKSKDSQYHYNYSLMKAEDSKKPQYYKAEVIAKLEGCILTNPEDALRVWYDVKSRKLEITSKSPIKNNDFGLVVDIFTDEEVNLADLIKHIFDGIITSFHVYEPKNLDDCNRTKKLISYKLKLNEENTSRLDELLKCSDDRESLLGKRRIFWYTKDGIIQTSPADDRCIFGELVKSPNKNEKDAKYMIDFKVLSLEPSQH